MNVWVALMNLENTYGGEEALMKLVERALQYTNQKKLYLHLIEIFRRTENYTVNICPQQRQAYNIALLFYVGIF